MLEPRDHVDVHDVSPEQLPPVPRLLEMYQAGRGDLLRIRSPKGSIIIDSGPSECGTKLEELLNEEPCRLMILTHLDADHFGGLQRLVTDHLNGRFSKPVRWPEFIWVNDFESLNAISAVLGSVGAAPESVVQTQAEFSKLIDAANEWREQADHKVHSMRGVDVPQETEILIEADPAAFRYLSMTAPVPWLRHLLVELKYLDVLREVVEELQELPLKVLRKLPKLIDDVRNAHEIAEAEIRAIGVAPIVFGEAIAYDDGGVLVRAAQRFRIHCRGEELRDLVTAGDIPPQMTHDVRSLLHLARNGPRLLQSIEKSAEVLPLVEALRQRLENVTVIGAKAGDNTSRFSEIAHLDILGPDDEELHALARVWERVRRKGAIHIDRRNDAFWRPHCFVQWFRVIRSIPHRPIGRAFRFERPVRSVPSFLQEMDGPRLFCEAWNCSRVRACRTVACSRPPITEVL